MSVPSDGARQAAFCAALVDEWARGGVTEAVVCPGSRSTPLALALDAHPALHVHVRLDERGAGFFALGAAQASGHPAVVCTTSGTAAAELHAAVVEADLGRVGLLVCTADRPPELQEVGAPQAIDQTHLYGSAVRWSFAPGVPASFPEHAWRPLGARALAEASLGRSGPGPVHLNLAFVDPLVAAPGDLPPGRPAGEPWHTVAPATVAPSADAVRSSLARLSGRPGIIVAGAGCGPPELVLALAEALGWPLLADPRSGCRVRHRAVVGAADAILRSPSAAAALRPEAAVLLGTPPASKVVAAYLGEAADGGAAVVAVDPWWRWADPERAVVETHPVEPGAWLRAVLDAAGGAAPGAWRRRWARAERAAQEAIDEALAKEGAPGELSEPAVARRLLTAVPATATVVVASSMPFRDLEWFAPPMDRPPRVLANRGANGIDGVGATAQGVAASSSDPVVGVLGDLAFLHDASSLVRPATGAGGRVTLLVVDNGGGGIFSFLPQADALRGPRFESLFGTPQAPDVAAVAAGFGLPVTEVRTGPELDAALASVRDPLAVVRARVPGRDENVALHARLAEAVAAAVAPALA